MLIWPQNELPGAADLRSVQAIVCQPTISALAKYVGNVSWLARRNRIVACRSWICPRFQRLGFNLARWTDSRAQWIPMAAIQKIRPSGLSPRPSENWPNSTHRIRLLSSAGTPFRILILRDVSNVLFEKIQRYFIQPVPQNIPLTAKNQSSETGHPRTEAAFRRIVIVSSEIVSSSSVNPSAMSPARKDHSNPINSCR